MAPLVRCGVPQGHVPVVVHMLARPPHFTPLCWSRSFRSTRIYTAMDRTESLPPSYDIIVSRSRSGDPMSGPRERALRGVTVGRLSYDRSATPLYTAMLIEQLTLRAHLHRHESYREPTSTLRYHRQQTEVRGPHERSPQESSERGHCRSSFI